MITNPIGNPKVTILTSLLLGALAVAAFTLGQRKGDLFGDSAVFERRDVPAADSPVGSRPATLASGKVSLAPGTTADASLTQVLDAIRASLQRNDLGSARVLLGAEQSLYKDDPRIAALQTELQAREGATNHAPAVVENPLRSPAAPHSGRPAWRSASRPGHGRTVSQPIQADADSGPQYEQGRHATGVEIAPNPSVGARNDASSDVSSSVPVNQPVTASPPRPAQPVVDAPPVTQSVVLSPPVTQTTQTTQSDAKPASLPAVASQAPKTRAEVEMEIERARTDGALPRFGNPDPAGPGGAPSMISHPVVLNW
jgi:hypothetical protein